MTSILPTNQDTRPLRIVLEHKLGPYPGLRQIVGTTDDFKDEPAPPVTSEPFHAFPDQRAAQAGLVKFGHSYLLYREIDFSLPVRVR